MCQVNFGLAVKTSQLTSKLSKVAKLKTVATAAKVAKQAEKAKVVLANKIRQLGPMLDKVDNFIDDLAQGLPKLQPELAPAMGPGGRLPNTFFSSKMDDMANKMENFMTGKGSGAGKNAESIRTTFNTKNKNGDIVSVVDVYKTDKTIVPVNKIDKYARGKTKGYDAKRLDELQELKQSNRKEFDKLGLEKELKVQKDMKHNFERSQSIKVELEKIGFADTPANNKILADFLSEVGAKASKENSLLRNLFEGPNGSVIIESRWKILDEGNYLSTLIIMGVK